MFVCLFTSLDRKKKISPSIQRTLPSLYRNLPTEITTLVVYFLVATKLSAYHLNQAIMTPSTNTVLRFTRTGWTSLGQVTHRPGQERDGRARSEKPSLIDGRRSLPTRAISHNLLGRLQETTGQLSYVSGQTADRSTHSHSRNRNAVDTAALNVDG